MKKKISSPTPLFNLSLLKEAKSEDLFQFECHHCTQPFFARKKDYMDSQSTSGNTSIIFCSQKCNGQSRLQQIKVECAHCKTFINRTPSQLKKLKKTNSFCSRSCSATYNNLHKTTGSRRSKLEVWLELKIPTMYPNLQILFNDKQAINSELDIYIPTLNLAFELNGIYHYEPIHGSNKFQQIQNNDKRKFQACLEKSINLCIIDTSQMKYFKELNCQKYLDIIKNIIDQARKIEDPTPSRFNDL